jgi:UDP-2,4-diacetamido-2,4,6-trideoxy-beta-L-altropyranose hydrolase
MRCLTLADGLRLLGASVLFICRDLPGNLTREVKSKNFGLVLIGENSGIDDIRDIILDEGQVDWLVVDSYDYDIEWENAVRDLVGQILAIDDLANRRHNCDMLLDQNLYPNAEKRYRKLVPGRCQMLLGPKYALLRRDFYQIRRRLLPRDGIIRRLLISMGGADPQALTEKAVAAFDLFDKPDAALDVVIGSANPRIETIREICPFPPRCRIHHPAENMARLIADADICIGTAGSTTWERCCLSLPALLIAAGENEVEIASAAQKAGIGKYLGLHNKVNPETIAEELKHLSNRPDVLQTWGANAAGLVDGQGLERVCRAITEYSPAEVPS